MKLAVAAARQRGLTMIELMVTVAVVALLVAVAAPSFSRFIAVQRIKGINAELLTDLQYARAESASRNLQVTVAFDDSAADYTCYSVFVGQFCSCSNDPVCFVGFGSEIKTVRIPRSTGIVLNANMNLAPWLAFDPPTGRVMVGQNDFNLPSTDPFFVSVNNPQIGGYMDKLTLAGRPSACSPNGAISGAAPC